MADPIKAVNPGERLPVTDPAPASIKGAPASPVAPVPPVPPVKGEADPSFEWCFRYEGPASGLNVALSSFFTASTKFADANAKAQFVAVTSLLAAENDLGKMRSLRIVVRGNSVSAGSSTRDLMIEFTSIP